MCTCSGSRICRRCSPQSLGADLAPLRQVLEHWRLTSHFEMSRAMASRRTDELLADWEMLLESLVEMPTDDRPDATTPIGELAGKQIRKVYKQVVRMGSRIDASSPPYEYHELRKKGKELRYTLELFGTQVHAPEVVDGLVRSLKALQDVLGRHQDREVQIAMLRSLADEVSTLPRGPKAVMAMGVLVDRLRVDEDAARAEFGERFAALASADQRHLVNETFG
jgi:CHAD domain-containing protein